MNFVTYQYTSVGEEHNSVDVELPRVTGLKGALVMLQDGVDGGAAYAL